MDLNDLKYRNGELGHDADDSLLQHLAARLSVAIRGPDFSCRDGGEEFVSVLDDID